MQKPLKPSRTNRLAVDPDEQRSRQPVMGWRLFFGRVLGSCSRDDGLDQMQASLKGQVPESRPRLPNIRLIADSIW